MSQFSLCIIWYFIVQVGFNAGFFGIGVIIFINYLSISSNNLYTGFTVKFTQPQYVLLLESLDLRQLFESSQNLSSIIFIILLVTCLKLTAKRSSRLHQAQTRRIFQTNREYLKSRFILKKEYLKMNLWNGSPLPQAA